MTLTDVRLFMCSGLTSGVSREVKAHCVRVRAICLYYIKDDLICAQGWDRELNGRQRTKKNGEIVSLHPASTLFFSSLLRMCNSLLLLSFSTFFSSVLGITRKSDQWELGTLKLVFVVNSKIRVELNTHYTYTLAVCTPCIYLCVQQICTDRFFILFCFFLAEGAEPKKHAKLASHRCIKQSFM